MFAYHQNNQYERSLIQNVGVRGFDQVIILDGERGGRRCGGT